MSVRTGEKSPRPVKALGKGRERSESTPRKIKALVGAEEAPSDGVAQIVYPKTRQTGRADYAGPWLRHIDDRLSRQLTNENVRIVRLARQA